jgi:sortase B
LIDKTPNKVGSVFVDYRTKIGESKQVNIYGHSSGNYDIPFDNLKKYLDKKFYEENRIITIDTIDGRYTYEIFSVKVTDDEEHD